MPMWFNPCAMGLDGSERWDAAPTVKGAVTTERLGAAEVFSNIDQHGVVLVVQSHIGRNRFHKKLLKFIVALLIGHPTVARKNPLGVGVDDEDGLFSGVEEDGIGGLRASPIDGE